MTLLCPARVFVHVRVEVVAVLLSFCLGKWVKTVRDAVGWGVCGDLAAQSACVWVPREKYVIKEFEDVVKSQSRGEWW